jgi:hypothetical protein
MITRLELERLTAELAAIAPVLALERTLPEIEALTGKAFRFLSGLHRDESRS